VRGVRTVNVMSVRVTWETDWEALGEVHQDEIISWRRDIFAQRPDEPVLTWEPGALGGVVLYCDDHLASFFKILRRTIKLDDVEMEAGGVSGVMTVPKYRGRGFAGLALAEARRVIFEVIGAKVGFLLCPEHLVSFYSRNGWTPLQCPVVFDQPDGKRTWHEKSMILWRDQEEKEPRSVDLCGLPW